MGPDTQEFSFNGGYRPESKKLVLKNIPIDCTKTQIVQALLADFKDVNIFMPKNTENAFKKTKLAFVDFQQVWHAKVARKLINLTQFGKITAEFADYNETILLGAKLPELLPKQTLIQDGEVPQQAKCAQCSDSRASHVCIICFTKYSATFYCNRDCQSRDWSIHKRYCKPLPKLAAVKDAQLEEKPMHKFIVPFVEAFAEGDVVKLTHFQNERVLFVRPVKENFEELLAFLNKSGTKTKLTEKPEVNDTVLAPFNGTHQRAQVMDVFEEDSNGNDVQAFFLDFGHSTYLSWHDLRKLSFKARSLARQTFKVVLEDVVNVGMKSEVKKYLESLYLKAVELKIIRTVSRGPDRFVVLAEPNGTVVNDFLKNFSLVDRNEKIFFTDMITKLKNGSNIKVRVTESLQPNGLISVMEAENYSTIWKLDSALNDYVNTTASNEVYDPLLNEVCVVKVSERWKRAVVTEVQPEIVSVRLIDVGTKSEDVPRNSVRRLPNQFSTSFFTDNCLIENWDEKKFEAASSKIKVHSNQVVDEVSYDEEKNITKLFFRFLDY